MTTPSTWQAPEPEAGPAPGVAFADPGSRLVAYIIDLVVNFVIIIALGIATGQGEPAQGRKERLLLGQRPSLEALVEVDEGDLEGRPVFSPEGSVEIIEAVPQGPLGAHEPLQRRAHGQMPASPGATRAKPCSCAQRSIASETRSSTSGTARASAVRSMDLT